MNYLIYKTTNLVNKKFYIGHHKTGNISDGYMGSGILLNKAIKKYGIENFSREILFVCSSYNEMIQKEIEIVNEEFVKRTDTYNMTIGGIGSWWVSHNDPAVKARRTAAIKQEHNTPESKARQSAAMKKYHSDPEVKAKLRHTMREVWNCAGYKEKRSAMSRRSLTREEKENQRLIQMSLEVDKKRKDSYLKIQHQQGEKNSQFGSMWITNGTENKKVKKDNLIPDGWHKGRKLS